MSRIYQTRSAVRITAIQFDGTNHEEIKIFAGEFVVADGANLIIRNNGDVLTAKVGDFIIRGTKGEFYPCPEEVMSEKYVECKELHEVKSNFISHKQPCIWVEKETGLYPNGAHVFVLKNCVGWDNENQQTDFVESNQTIRFVRKDESGLMVEGVTTEQLLIAIAHRHEGLNNAFPSKENEQFIFHIKSALDLLEQRVKDRVVRGVMGELKK